MSVYEEAVRRAAEQRALAQAANIPDPLMFGLDYADVIEQQIAPVVARQTWRSGDMDDPMAFSTLNGAPTEEPGSYLAPAKRFILGEQAARESFSPGRPGDVAPALIPTPAPPAPYSPLPGAPTQLPQLPIGDPRGNLTMGNAKLSDLGVMRAGALDYGAPAAIPAPSPTGYSYENLSMGDFRRMEDPLAKFPPVRDTQMPDGIRLVFPPTAQRRPEIDTSALFNIPGLLGTESELRVSPSINPSASPARAIASPTSLSTQEDEWRRQNAGRTPALAPVQTVNIPPATVRPASQFGPPAAEQFNVLEAIGALPAPAAPNTAVDAPVVGARTGPVPPGRDFIEIQDAQTGELRRTYLNAPSIAVPVAANATEQQRMLAQQGVDLANMTIRRTGTPDIVDGVATFPAYEVPLNRQNVSPEQLSVLQAIGVLPYDDPAAEIARQQANAKSRAEMARAAAEMQAAQNDAAAAARPKLMEVGGSVISVDPTTGAVTPVYSTPAKPDVRLVSQPDGTQLAVDMNAVTPGQTVGTPSARKPTDIVSDDSGAFESEEVRRQVQRFLGQSEVDWNTIRSRSNELMSAENPFDLVDPKRESRLKEYMASILADSVEDPDNLADMAQFSTQIKDETRRKTIQAELKKIAKRLNMNIDDDLAMPGTKAASGAAPASGGNRFLDPGIEEELQ